MKRCAVALGTLLLVAGCSDDRDQASMLAGPHGLRTARVLEHLGTVDALIDALFRGGNVTAARARWNTVLRLDANGDVERARKHMFDLAAYLLKKQRQGQLVDPDGSGDASVQDGVNKMLALMFGAVYPDAPPFPAQPNGDAVVALIDGSAQTVVTPQRRAGIELDEGSTHTPFLLVIDENPVGVYPRCGGPLATARCQFPLFYRFTPYPETRLAKKARFGVCTLEEGHPYGPADAAQHERMRLAHDVGGHDVDDPNRVVDGIAVMPYVAVDFLDCDGISYAPPPILHDLGVTNPVLRGGLAIAARLGRALAGALTPRNAYAIDRGGGGKDDFFSPFNAVDTGTFAGTMDFAPSAPLAQPAVVVPGEPVSMTFAFSNAGTITTGAAIAIASLRQVALPHQQLALDTFPIPPIGAGASVQVTRAVVTPQAPAGAYELLVVADAANSTAEGHTLGIEIDGEGLSEFRNDIFLHNGTAFVDDVRLFDGTAPSDTDLDGSTDGSGAVTTAVPVVTYELAHPLNSGDRYDIARAPGQSLRFMLALRMLAPDAVFPEGYGDTDWPAFGQFATITLAPATPPIP